MANFATLDSLKKGDEDKEKKGNAYYAGGARGAGHGGRCVCRRCEKVLGASALLFWVEGSSVSVMGTYDSRHALAKYLWVVLLPPCLFFSFSAHL